MNRRPLRPADQALWNVVARSVDPLPGRHILADPEIAAALGRPSSKKLPKSLSNPVGHALRPQPPRLPAAATLAAGGLDGSWDRRIARGRIEPDRTIDLHGLTLDQAWRRLDFALEDAVFGGARALLVVTGKAARDPSAGRASPVAERPRGMIRAKLDDWLGASRHAGCIASIRSAHPRHGGAGAVYVILRKMRG